MRKRFAKNTAVLCVAPSTRCHNDLCTLCHVPRDDGEAVSVTSHRSVEKFSSAFLTSSDPAVLLRTRERSGKRLPGTSLEPRLHGARGLGRGLGRQARRHGGGHCRKRWDPIQLTKQLVPTLHLHLCVAC